MEKGLVLGNDVPEEYLALVEPHVASFDYFLSEGMHLAVESIEPIEVRGMMAIRRPVAFGLISRLAVF